MKSWQASEVVGMSVMAGLLPRPLVELLKILLPVYLGAEAFAMGIYWLVDYLDRRMGRTQHGPPLSREEYARALQDLRKTIFRRALVLGGFVELGTLVFVMLLALVGVIDLMVYGVTALLTATICTTAIVGPPVIAVYLLQKSEIARRIRAE